MNIEQNQNTSEKEGIEKYTLTPDGITQIFQKLSSEKPSPNKSIQVNINLQYSGQKNETIYYTLCDCHHHFKYFLFKKPPFSLQNDEIINLKDISYNYDSNTQFFTFIIHQYEIKSKALYQILPFTTLFNVNKYLNIFSFSKKMPIDYFKYNLLNDIDTLPKKLTFYVRVISKVTLTSFTKNKENKHDGNFFYFDVVDLNYDTIRVIATYSNANYYYSKIKMNSIYVISGNFFLHELTRYQEHNKSNPLYKFCKELKMPNKEIYLGNDSKIYEMDSDDPNLICVDENKYIIYDDIKSILNMNNSFVDLVNTIGVIVKVEGCFKVTYPLRKITLLDNTNSIIRVNLWNQYTLYPVKVGDVLLIKNIQVKKYDENNHMTTVDETCLTINPDIEKTNELKLVYQNFISNSDNYLFLKPSLNNLKKNSKKIKKNNHSILQYFNNQNNNNGKFIFIRDLINSKNNNNKQEKCIYGYINKVIYNKKEDIIDCSCLLCLKPLSKKGSFWNCINCKKNYIFPSCFYKDIILNIIDSSGNIDIVIQKEKIKEIFGVSPDKINSLEEIKKLEEIIKYDSYLFHTKNKYNESDKLIIENFNKAYMNEFKDNNMTAIKKYLNQ